MRIGRVPAKASSLCASLRGLPKIAKPNKAAIGAISAKTAPARRGPIGPTAAKLRVSPKRMPMIPDTASTAKADQPGSASAPLAQQHHYSDQPLP